MLKTTVLFLGVVVALSRRVEVHPLGSKPLARFPAVCRVIIAVYLRIFPRMKPGEGQAST